MDDGVALEGLFGIDSFKNKKEVIALVVVQRLDTSELEPYELFVAGVLDECPAVVCHGGGLGVVNVHGCLLRRWWWLAIVMVGATVPTRDSHPEVGQAPI